MNKKNIMKKTIILLAFIFVACGSSKYVEDNYIQTKDSTSTVVVDSTSIHNARNEDINLNEDINTTITETITETVTDTTNNIVINRVINRQIKQTAEKTVSSVIKEQNDTIHIKNETTQETKDNEVITTIDNEVKESNKLKYVFYILLVLLVGYIVIKFI